MTEEKLTFEQSLKKLIEKYKPDEIALEELFFNNNQKTAINVAQARGVILLTCVKECGRLYEYTPLQIKQAITGYGRADKNQIQQMVKTLLGLKGIPKPDDAADALAVALTHAQTNKLGGLFSI
jgi:crossover junction endodeoxyribonuclease RuvC